MVTTLQYPRQTIQYDKVDNSDRMTEPNTLFHALLHKPSEQLYPAYAPRANWHTCPTSWHLEQSTWQLCTPTNMHCRSLRGTSRSMNTHTEGMNQVREQITNREWTLTSTTTQHTPWPNMVMHPPLKPYWVSPTSHTPQTHWGRHSWPDLGWTWKWTCSLDWRWDCCLLWEQVSAPHINSRDITHTGPHISVERNS